MSKLHLSYDEFKYFYGDLGVTYWSEYNWLSNDYVGKYNVWDEDWETGRISSATGQNSSGNGLRSKNYINVLTNKKYNVYFGVYPSASFIVYFYDENKSYISSLDITLSKTFTSLSNCVYVRFAIFTSSSVTYNNDIRIYQPVLDLESKKIVDISWTYTSSRFYGTLVTKQVASNVIPNIYAKGYITTSYDGRNPSLISIYQAGWTDIVIYNSLYNNVDDFLIGNKDISIVYEKA